MRRPLIPQSTFRRRFFTYKFIPLLSLKCNPFTAPLYDASFSEVHIYTLQECLINTFEKFFGS